MKHALAFLAAAATLSLLLPTASAHLTVTAVTPTAPLVFGQATKIRVTVAANCATVLAEYQVEKSKTSLELELQAPAPSWLTGVGETVPFKAENCGADGNVKSTGNVSITPSLLAPGLQQVNISFGAKGESGTATVPVTIAYRAAIEAAPEMLTLDVVDGNATGLLAFNASINADSMAMIEIVGEPTQGTLDIASSLEIASPIAENKSARSVAIPFTYRAIPGAVSEDIVVRLMIHSVKDPAQASEIKEVTLRFTNATVVESTPTASADAKGFLPAPGPMVLALGLLAIAILRRRRE